MLCMSKLAIALAIGIASASTIGGSYLFVKLKPQMRNWHVFTQLSFYSIMVLLKHSSNYNRTYPNQFFLFHYGTTESSAPGRPEAVVSPFSFHYGTMQTLSNSCSVPQPPIMSPLYICRQQSKGSLNIYNSSLRLSSGASARQVA